MRLIITLLLLCLAAPSFAAIEVDSDSNSSIDLTYGGTNATTAAGARTNLGLGTAAVEDVGTDAGDIVQLDGTGKLPAVDGSQLVNIATTDDQTIDTFSLGGTTLSLSLEGDGQAPQTVDLSSLQDGTGTDDQTAAEVPVTDSGANYTATDVEGVLAEIAGQLGGATQLDALTDVTGTGTLGYVLTDDGDGTYSFGAASAGDLLSTNNLSDLANAATARTNLGLGTAATVNTGTTIGTAVLWQDDGSGNASIPIGTFNPDTTAGYQVGGAQLTAADLGGTDDQTAAEVSVADSGAYYTATDVEGVLAEIAPQLGGTDDQTASEVNITDSGGYYTGTTVEAALQELGTAGASGNYVSAPTYSDDTATAGQYATDGSYFYIATATDTWDRVALAGWSNPAPTPPTLSSATLGTDGTTLTLVFSEAITQGTGYLDSQLDLDASTTGSNIGLTYSSGNTTDTHVYTAASTINSGETVDFDFDGTADSLEDSAGDDLAAIVSTSVDNQSEQGGVAISDDFSSDTTSNYTAITTSGVAWDSTLQSLKSAGATYEAIWAYNSTATVTNDHYAQGDLTFTADGSGNYGRVGLIVRSNGTTGYIARFHTGTSVQLESFNGGAATAVSSWTVNEWTDGATHTVKVEASGSSFTLYIDENDDGDFLDAGETYSTKTDSTYVSGSYVGVYLRDNYAGAAPRVDNFEADSL